MDKLKDLVEDCITKLKNEKSCIAIKGNKKDFISVRNKFLEILKEENVVIIEYQRNFDLDDFLKKKDKKLIIYSKKVYNNLRERWIKECVENALLIPGIKAKDDVNMKKVYLIDLYPLINSRKDYSYRSYYDI